MKRKDQLASQEPQVFGTTFFKNGLKVAFEGPISRLQQGWYQRYLASPSQEGALFYAWRVPSDFDLTLFSAALQDLVACQPALRTIYPLKNGQPFRRVFEDATLHVEEIDSVDGTDASVFAHLRSLASFDFEIEAPLHWALFRRVGKPSVLGLVTHMLVLDSASALGLLHQIHNRYNNLKDGISKPLEKAPDFLVSVVEEEKSLKQGPQADLLKKFWDLHAGSDLPILNLQADFHRPPALSCRGKIVRHTVDSLLAKTLLSVASDLGISIGNLWLSMFQALLHRYSGQDDVVVGLGFSKPIDALGSRETEAPIRSFLKANATFANFAASQASLVTEIARNANSLMLFSADSNFDPSRSQLFQARFVWREDMAFLSWDRLPIRERADRLDLGLVLSHSHSSDQTVLSVEYAQDLFDAATIDRLLENFLAMAACIAKNPHQKLSSLQILTEAEHYDLVVVRNRTQFDYAQDRCFFHLFEDQVRLRPDAIAVSFEDRHLTYHELNQRANQVAHYLRGMGVGPESFVGLCMHRSSEMVVGLLGILKAGGAYVPLDPGFPQDRLEYMVEDSGLGVLLTQDSLANYIGGHSAPILRIDSDWPSISKHSSENPNVALPTSSRAYVIYTSGSTGKPKGVQIGHQAFMNFIVSMGYEPGLGPEDILLSVTTLSFDICGLELWLPLIKGARIVIAPKEVTIDGVRLLDLLISSKATMMQATPVSWRLMLGAGWQPSAYPLTMLCGGEPLPSELAGELVRFGTLWNMYGPTETTVWSTLHKVETGKTPISIGHPIANTEIYILDKQVALLPLGVAGELIIGGDGLARGYHSRPSLTAQQFIPNPYSGSQGARMYKTGDLARYLSNGDIECLGRIDTQVKVRGYRIELGEIESAIIKFEQVKQVVVLVREDSPGDKMLIGYVKPSKKKVDVNALRQFMREFLPEYMIPSAFVHMNDFPLTPNGKVDKKSLPAPDWSKIDLGNEYVAPRTELEELIAGVWANTLRVPKIGVNDNFFQLGGHSLIATQIISRLREALQVEVSQPRFFKEPTVAALSRIIDELRSNGFGQMQPPIMPRNSNQPIPLSPNQYNLWFIDSRSPGNIAYNIPYAFTISGKPNWDAFEKALKMIVSRHEALRTTFSMLGGQPVQSIHETVDTTLHHVDYTGMPSQEQDGLLLQEAKAEGRRPFALSVAPLFRFSVIHLSEDRHFFMATFHHTIFDGWSEGVFLRELMDLYEVAGYGKPTTLRDLAIQFADFTLWQKEWFSGDVLENERSFWKKRLQNAQTVLELPRDKPRPKTQTFDGSFKRINISKGMSMGLAELSKANGATLFMTMQAVFSTLLYRYTNQVDILVGTPIANRHRAETEPLLGYFVNTVVLRTDLSGKPSFTTVLNRVRENTLASFSNANLSFDQVVDVSNVKRDMSRNPLFQVMFVLHNNPMPQLKCSDFEMSMYEIERGLAQFDLTLVLTQSEDGLHGGFDYNTNLFNLDTVERLATNFVVLLDGVLTDPNCSICNLPIMTESERHRLLIEWNDNNVDIPGCCAFQMFEAQAERNPEKIAILFEEISMTYREMNERANQLAHHLRSIGIGPDMLVGISMKRTPDMTISMFGIHKSGGAYVPLDPKHPVERIQYILEEARVSVIVTQCDLSDRLKEQTANIVEIDSPGRFKDVPVENPVCVSNVNHLSHVIYTSGSTGKPKGVAIEHKSVTALVVWHRKLYNDEELSGTLASTSMNFDISVYENIGTLALGGTIILVENALYLPVTSKRFSVKLINTVPSAIKELLRQKAIPPSVITVNLAGEPLKESVVQDLYSYTHIQRVFNLYGPSEDTTYSTWALMERDPNYSVMIGIPLPCTQAYVLDENLNPTPMGVPGELYLSGIGLARGYLNRPDLTEDRFLPDPFSADSKSRIYKTGDLVRYRSNGELECLGRIDHQVKIRGFRIELGEIEAILQKHSAVRESIVVDRELKNDEKYLVGYVTCKDGQSVDAKALRTFVGEHLPEYMVPAYVLVLSEMPLNPNGKIDRKLLPEPEVEVSAISEQDYQPKTEQEAVIASIWKEVLGLSCVGMKTNYFEIGGNSLNATQVRFLTEERLGCEMQINDIFQYPTIEDLAQYLSQKSEGSKIPRAGSIEKYNGSELAPLSLSQQRLWFVNILTPGESAYNIPFLLRLEGQINISSFERALSAVVDRHEALRTSFRTIKGVPYQAVSENIALTLEIIRLTHINDQKTRWNECLGRAKAESLRSFDLEKPPLFRFMLYELSNEQFAFQVVLHHTIADGWSIGILLSELVSLYEKCVNDQPVVLDPLPLQYSDYARWHQKWYGEESNVLEYETKFWLSYLSDAKTVLELPIDKPRPPKYQFDGAMVKIAVPGTVSNAIKALGKREDATLFMTLQSVFAVLLYRYTGQEDILTGTPMACRNFPETQKMIGMFVNTLVVRNNLSANPSFVQVLRRTRETVLDVFNYQEFPFDYLVEKVSPERSMSRNPLFQVMFALQDNLIPDLSNSHFRMSFEELDRGKSHFDLTLYLEDSKDGIHGVIEYNTSLFLERTIVQMGSHFNNLISSVLADSHSPIWSLPILADEELKRILFELNDHPLDLSCLAPFEMFEFEAQKNPGKIAIYFENETLTYSDVNERANKLAHLLRSLGVGPDKLVGISQERTPNMTISMFGVHKAGGAYVPLDPKHPEDRIKYIMDEANVEVIITQEHLRSKLQGQCSSLVVIDDENSSLEFQPRNELEKISKLDNLSHVIYTSGSTGKPKGVAIEHVSVTQLTNWVALLYSETELSGMLASTSMNFDLSVYENISTLALGGQIILVENALFLPSISTKEKVVTINTVPSAIKELLRQKGIPKSVKVVNLAGEPLKESVVQDLYALPHVEKVYNLYGPSEDTTYSTWALMGREKDYKVMIGEPLPLTQAYVLDRNIQPVPLGVPGELYLGGIGLARGYLNRPDLTEERFISNPFSGNKTDRIYRTGDLVKWKSIQIGGENILQLECLGRIDHQVKIRGFRIELGEIESALLSHPSVRESIVVDKETENGEKILVGYVTIKSGLEVDGQTLRIFVGTHLPEYMVPQYMIILDEMPLNPNGKIDRKLLPSPKTGSAPQEVHNTSPSSNLELVISRVWSEVLGLEKVSSQANFFEIGGNSLNVTRIRFLLEEELKKEIKITDLFQFPTISSLADFIEPKHTDNTLSSRSRKTTQNDIAVIGMSLKFPGADTVDTFWNNLCMGVESIREFSKEELLANGEPLELISDPYYVSKGFTIDGYEYFDADFFGMSPREAQITDPQHRLFLEKCYEALESSGYAIDAFDGRVGVFGGSSANSYFRNHILPNKKLIDSVGHYGISIGSEKDYMTTRVSYKMNLRGPSLTIQTACSTGLMTVHVACRNLIDGECDLALAGGVSIWLPMKIGYLYADGGTMSPDGHVRPFDHRARGMMAGSGVGVVVLKRLAEALADNDCIYSIVKGTSSNNDGSVKAGFTAPSVRGQAIAIKDAQELGDINPETISYIEAHGTGTSLGDPIEVAALTQVFREKTDKLQFCGIGSLKANIGHLDAAAGISGFIKTVLALHHKKIPPTINFEAENPAINFEKTPFYVVRSLSEWVSLGSPRRAAVSSFGIGGTNVHAILEEAPVKEASSLSRPFHLLSISAKTKNSLNNYLDALGKFLEANSKFDLADVGFTLNKKKKHFPVRTTLIGSSIEDVLEQLKSKTKIVSELNDEDRTEIVFMFPGQGSQYINMGYSLYINEPIFKRQVDACSEILMRLTGYDIRDIVWPLLKRSKVEIQEFKDSLSEQLSQTSFVQPALFTFEYSLATLLMSFGVIPDAMIGHSVGEYVAATLSGVFQLEDALELVAARGRLMQSMPKGSMLGLSMSESDVIPLLTGNVQIAAINSSQRVVVSGPDEEIEEFNTLLEKLGKKGVKLVTSHAFHSSMMDGCLESFREKFENVKFGNPKIKYVSNLTGEWIKDEESSNPNYYLDHLRRAVRFSDGLKTILESKRGIYIEVGPGRTLVSFFKQQELANLSLGCVQVVNAPKSTEDERKVLCNALAEVWRLGGIIDWKAYYEGESRSTLPLPTYAFEKNRHWLDFVHAIDLQSKNYSCGSHEENKKPGPSSRIDLNGNATKFFQPLWKQTSSAPLFGFTQMTEKRQSWLIMLDSCGLGLRIVEHLNSNKQDVVVVKIGEWYSKENECSYIVNPGRKTDYFSLLKDLADKGRIPNRVIHLWSVTDQRTLQKRIDFCMECQDKGFLSLVFLTQAYQSLNLNEMLHVGAISNNMQEVTEGDLTMPEKATLLGAIKVIPREYPNMDVRSIDVVIPANEQSQLILVKQILGELAVTSPDSVIAYRGRRRWLQIFEPTTFGPVTIEKDRLRHQGVYLITGGLGSLGLVLATHLAKTCSAKLILIGRSKFPDRKDWQDWLGSHPNDDPTSIKIKQFLEIERLGGKVCTLNADISVEAEVRRAVDFGEKIFGSINGVFHAAGVNPSGPISEMTREKAHQVLAPKVSGTLALESTFKNKNLDFILLFSSTSSILGHLGNADYCAGNSFLDAFAHSKNSNLGVYTISVNSDGWREAGMAANENPMGRKVFEEMLSNSEGIDGLRRILSADFCSQIVMSTRDITKELEKVHAFEVEHVSDEPLNLSSMINFNDVSSFDFYSDSKTEDNDPGIIPILKKELKENQLLKSETEKILLEIWKDSLGISDLTVHDNFGDLGGDSLLATMISTRLRKAFKISIPPKIFDDFPNISTMVVAIDNLLSLETKKVSVDLDPEVDIKDISDEGDFVL